MKKLTRSETIAKNKADKRINAAFISTCSRIQINIMDTTKVFAHGHKLIAEGADDAALAKGVREFVETIRVDKPQPSVPHINQASRALAASTCDPTCGLCDNGEHGECDCKCSEGQGVPETIDEQRAEENKAQAEQRARLACAFVTMQQNIRGTEHKRICAVRHSEHDDQALGHAFVAATN